MRKMPPNSLDFYDKDFVYKTGNVLEVADYEEKEIMNLIGISDCKSTHRHTKLLKSLLKHLDVHRSLTIARE